MSSTYQQGPDAGLPARTPPTTDNSGDGVRSQALLSGSSMLSPHWGEIAVRFGGQLQDPRVHFPGESG